MPELDVLRGVAVLMVVVLHGLYWEGAVSSSRIGTLIIKASVVGWLGSIGTAPLRFLGYISYGLYLYHLIIFSDVYDRLVRHIANPALRISLRGSFTSLFLAGALAICVSWISRRFFEEYFLHFKGGL
jgi:peptidoglycan/LPS O-acetylase OafA/YrhL